MAQFQNLMEVFKLLEKTNCRMCNRPTCLAFAAEVFKGERRLSQCPHIDPDVLEKYVDHETNQPNLENELEKSLEKLTARLKSIDFSSAARRTGAGYDGSKLTFKIMGKDFSVDTAGNISTDIHVNPWITGLTLRYIFDCKGVPLAGQWVSLRELPGGKDWDRFFSRQCERPLKKLADTTTDLFEDLVRIFAGRQVENHYQSDVALVLSPLPLVPMLICYWKPEDGLESNLNLFFDVTAGDNLGIEGVYALGTGIVRMFSKLAQRHGG